jgi:predicted transposase/invertase (TIGR01784 family)
MKKDIISKEIIKKVIKDIANKILNLKIDEFELIDTEFQKVEARKADILAKTPSFILHIELQSNYDKTMPYRMLRYYLDIRKIYNEPIKQFVIYLGKGNLPYKIDEDVLKFRYNLVDMKKIDCNIFLNSEVPESLVLAVLCDFQAKKPNLIIKEIIEKLIKISKSKEKFDNYVLMLEELSSLRNLQEAVKEYEMILTSKVKWEDLPSYEIGMQKGMEKGLQQGLEKGLQQGIKKEKERVILNGYKMGLNLEDIAKLTNLNIEEVRNILKNNNVEVN